MYVYTIYMEFEGHVTKKNREPQGIGPADGEDWGATGILK